MGTGLDAGVDSVNHGVIPRAVQYIYHKMNAMMDAHPDAAYEVRCSFMELYNEDLIDLLSPRKPNEKHPQIREDGKGGIDWVGVKQLPARNPEEVYGLLRKGSLCRTTGSTDMNLTSSRSHAVFSVWLQQRRPADEEEDAEVEDANKPPEPETTDAEAEEEGEEDKPAKLRPMRTLTSKFHFVDLAGSERLKKTHAEGSRKKEGIAINAGLLALGNVISSLVENTNRMIAGRKEVHVPYRDSKLTRLLQDSLGGNSQTMMLACVSPADSNFAESISTLRYASRARKIQNKARVNMEDPAITQAEVQRLRKQLARLQTELDLLRNGISGGKISRPTGNRVAVDDLDGPDDGRKVWLEQQLYRAQFETGRLKERVRDLEGECMQARVEKDSLLFERVQQQPEEEESEWEEYTDDEEPAESIEPVEPTEPVEAEEPTEPVEPTESTDEPKPPLVERPKRRRKKKTEEETDVVHPMINHYVRKISDLESVLRQAEDELAYWRDTASKTSAATSRVQSSLDVRRPNGMQRNASPFMAPPVANRSFTRTPQIMDINKVKCCVLYNGVDEGRHSTPISNQDASGHVPTVAS
jgi:hypothetical protein